jgi:hypothetical protein
MSSLLALKAFFSQLFDIIFTLGKFEIKITHLGKTFFKEIGCLLGATLEFAELSFDYFKFAWFELKLLIESRVALKKFP